MSRSRMFLLVVLASPPTTPLFADEPGDNEAAYLRLVRGTVYVHNTRDDDLSMNGSGVVVDLRRGWVVTNYHVVHRAKQLRVMFPAWHEGKPRTGNLFYRRNFEKIAVPAELVLQDKKADLAVIRLSKIPPEVEAVPIADRRPLIGEHLHAVGNPVDSGFLWLYTDGLVRGMEALAWTATVADSKFEFEARVFLAQLPFNSGDSGGPVVSADGELLGVMSSSFTSLANVSICISVEQIRGLLDEAVERDVAATRERLEGVIAEAAKAIEADAEDADGYSRRGMAFAELGRDADALKDFIRAMELKPNSDRCFNCGVAHLRQGQPALALTALNRAVELNPKDPACRRARAEAYSLLAEADLETADELEKASPDE